MAKVVHFDSKCNPAEELHRFCNKLKTGFSENEEILEKYFCALCKIFPKHPKL